MTPVKKAKLCVEAAVSIAILMAFVLPGASALSNTMPIMNPSNERPLFRANEWTEQASGFETQSRGIRFLDAVDSNVAWAIAYDGSGGNAPTTDLTHTTDGGTTWVPSYVLPSGNYGLGNICGLNGNIAYTALFSMSTQDSTCGVYKTINGGTSWTHLTTNPVSFANNVIFWNENVGVVLGDTKDGYFEDWTTVDGGTTWTRVPQANYTGVEAASGEGGWTGVVDVIGDTVIFGTNYGNVFISNDRGNHWFGSYSGASQGDLNPGVNEVAFKDATHGLAAHDNGASYDLFETSDGGQTWAPIVYSGNAYSSGLSYCPGTDNMYVTTGAAEGSSGASYSLDGGHTWIDYDEMVSIQMLEVDFVEGRIGWAGGFNTDATTGGMFKHVPGAPAPAFTIEITGGKGFTAKIKNVGDAAATNVDVAITIEGGFIIKPKTFSGSQATLAVGSEFDVLGAPKGIGLGIIFDMPRIKVHVSCDEGVIADKSADAKIIFTQVNLM